MRALALLSIVGAFLLQACGASSDGRVPGEASSLEDPGIIDGKGDGTASAKALLEIYALDIWAQALPQADRKLTVGVGSNTLTAKGWPVAVVPLSGAGVYHVSLSAKDHDPLELDVDYDGTDAVEGAALIVGQTMKGQGISLSHEMRGKQAVHSAYLGLRHQWFSAEGRPARRGNQLEFLMDGEEAWSRVDQDLRGSTESILLATWWWQSDFELVRDPTTHASLTPEQRWANTMLGILDSRPSYKRVLVGQFWGQDSILSFLNTDSELKAHADKTGDNFEFMGQANETSGVFTLEMKPFVFGDRVRGAWQETAPRAFDQEASIESTVPSHTVDLTQLPGGAAPDLASYHQKFAVIDGRVAFIGGMNVKSTDWDSSSHAVYESRRMEYGATEAERIAVKNKEALPDLGPRKDYMVRIDGPAAQDAADVFQERWQYLLDSHVEYADTSTRFEVSRNIPEHAGGVQAQVTATLPAPFWEHAIAETWFNAVRHAERYIYIEDQYFRMPMVNDAIVARMGQVPGLKLIVVTKPINEWTDLGCEWTYKSHETFKKAFPDRYRLYQLRSFDAVVTWGIDETAGKFQDMDTHSKILIVDDKFMSVGSCNKNNRGIVYEGELNVAVADEAWVRAARRRVFANILPHGYTATDDVELWWKQMGEVAAANDAVYGKWDNEGFDISLDGAMMPADMIPHGFLYSMDFPAPENCAIEGVGPDMTFH
jgi:hypothetical protein